MSYNYRKKTFRKLYLILLFIMIASTSQYGGVRIYRKPTFNHKDIILLFYEGQTGLIQLYHKGWFGARNICDEALTFNLAKFSSSRIKVGLQLVPYLYIDRVYISFFPYIEWLIDKNSEARSSLPS